MAVVLAATGSFLYLRLQADIDRGVDRALRARAGDVTALVKQADSGLTQAGPSPLTRRGESFGQILDRRGRVLDATPPLGRRALLGAGELRRAQQTTQLVDRRPLRGVGEPARLLATPVRAQGQRLVVVVGTGLNDRNDAVANLGGLLLLGGPLALLLASMAGYGLATAALRPVEAMRRRAAAVSATQPGQRLPLPRAADELALLGQTLNDMLARLEHALERERRFVADASHELRTPLTIVRGELELALEAGRSRGQLVGAIRSASEETERLIALSEQLLVLARSDSDGLPLRLAATPVRELLTRVRRRFEGRAVGAQREMAVEPGAELCVHADPERLEQALGNLVDNALRHGSGRVALGVHRRGAFVELHVTDEGEGFPAHFLPTAFDRFGRADHARTRGGTGLGLAIVKAVARAHGGDAGATNRAGTGADVWLSLPANAPPKPGSHQARGRGHSAAASRS